ncbi:acyltransferase family protein [Achromobacter aloeverae]|uniref:Acyltransferase n=1 Tax=Achromobacter aloeverae TaxID=1750518 RepID=A0A4Q1HFI3_9BURK|nr:acyltransferase [Achromobacter aloeverae]RXN85318.1 acyltransferase [Achromobacter aloeverae]
MTSGARDWRIDTLRGIAILLVLLHHFNIAYSLERTTLAAWLGWPLVHAIVRNGNYGVTMFFAVSGFLITRNALARWGSLARIRLADFYVLRAARILPCLVLVLLVVDTLALAGVRIFDNRVDAPVSLWTVNAAALTFWMNVLITRVGWVNYPLGVLWSLSVELVFYLLFPLLCIGLARQRRWLLPVLALMVVCAGPWYRLAHQGDAEAYLYGYLACFDAIAIGCCGAVLARRGGVRLPRTRAARALVAIAMSVLYLAWPIGESNVLGVTAMALGTAWLLLGAEGREDRGRQEAAPCGAGEGRMQAGRGPRRYAGRHRLARPLWITARWIARALAACGRRSYELYLLHLLVLGLARTAWPAAEVAGDWRLLMLAVYIALSIALASVVGRRCSDPANAVLRGRYFISN